jgi:hypothetical protein
VTALHGLPAGIATHVPTAPHPSAIANAHIVPGPQYAQPFVVLASWPASIAAST